jgi:hypothetical protein
MGKTLYNSIGRYAYRKKYVVAAFVVGSVAAYEAFKRIRCASRKQAEKPENKRTLVELVREFGCENYHLS